MTHGTHASYRSGCHCPACRAGAAAYERQRRAGIHVFIDAGHVAAHVRALTASGMSCAAIATAAGVCLSSVTTLKRGERQRCRRETAEAILAVTIDDYSPGHRMPARRIKPLLSEMQQAGYSKAGINRMLGLRSPWLGVGRDEYVMSKTVRRIVTLYRVLCRQGIVAASLLDEVGT